MSASLAAFCSKHTCIRPLSGWRSIDAKLTGLLHAVADLITKGTADFGRSLGSCIPHGLSQLSCEVFAFCWFSCLAVSALLLTDLPGSNALLADQCPQAHRQSLRGTPALACKSETVGDSVCKAHRPIADSAVDYDTVVLYSMHVGLALVGESCRKRRSRSHQSKSLLPGCEGPS